MNSSSAFWQVLSKEILQIFRYPHSCINPLLFFVIVVSLFPIAITPDPKMLTVIAPGVIWITALLALLISLERLFNDDFVDGSLSLLLMSSCPLSLLILAKILAHWTSHSLPLILITPLLGVFLHLSLAINCILMLTLLLGTPTLNLIGAIGVALTLGLNNSVILFILLILPLFVPVLIFGVSAVTTAAMGITASASALALLGALLIITLCLAPVAISAALRLTSAC